MSTYYQVLYLYIIKWDSKGMRTHKHNEGQKTKKFIKK